MQTRFNFLKRSRKLNILLLFIISIVIVVYLFPVQGKFQYEFTLNSQWMHDKLISPYDFPIYKLDNELKSERDSVSKQPKIYYRYNYDIFNQKIDSFNADFQYKWEFWIAELDSSKKTKNAQILKNIAKHKKIINDLMVDEIKKAYSRGILSQKDENIGKFREIIVLREQSADDYFLGELKTPYTAAEIVKMDIQDRFKLVENEIKKDIINTELFSEFLTVYDYKPYIAANLIYDENTTEKFKQSSLENISLARGMVHQGEVIILKGETVTKDKYRILLSLKREYEGTKVDSSNRYYILLGHFILVSCCFWVVYIFLKNFRNDIFQSSLKTSFILFMMVGTILIARINIRFNILSLYILPFTILPIIIRSFYDDRLATFIHVITILIISFLAPNGFEFFFLQYVAGILSVTSLKRLSRRGQLFATAFYISLTYSIVFFGISIMQHGHLQNIDWVVFGWFGINGVLVLTSYPLIYIFEKMFGFMSDITLIELTNTNHPLLRKLAATAPGTFHHSLQVAALAEEVIYEIGGNALLIRAGAMYHDIGKTHQPNYFTENQGEINPHDALEFDKSAEIIIGHVAKGVDLARSYKIPESIIEFITTHHGTSKVHYFYRSFLKKYPEEEIDVEKFKYPGPTPFTKEQSVLMMADSVEAATRSLQVFNEENIIKTIEKVIDIQINDKQHHNSGITFKHVQQIKEAFAHKLISVYHQRIAYPEEPKVLMA